MEDLRSSPQTKSELNIKDFDDIITEMLTNESMFNKFTTEIESLRTELSKLRDEFEDFRSKSETVKPKIESPPRALENVSPTTSETPGVVAQTPVKNVASEAENRCISNILFTHQLHPIFIDQNSPSSKGTAVYKDGIWEITMRVEILRAPEPSTIPEIPTGGYINYLNIQTPLNFSPKEVIKITADRSNILFKTEEAILGYIYYAPDPTVMYPHYVNINMILK